MYDKTTSVESDSINLKTPIADRLIEIRKQINHSFHALPLSTGASIINCSFREKYNELFGDSYLRTELTVTGKHFDSLFFPENVIKEAENLAANLYGADQTLFITTGTTTSNQIAMIALFRQNGRVLMDKNCHQSLHFALHALGIRVDYLGSSTTCIESGRVIFDINELLGVTYDAEKNHDPYDLIILNAHSYDGVVYNIPLIIKLLLDNGVSTRRFLIDEAWGAANIFSEQLKHCSAMNISSLRNNFDDLCVVSTQSAHKSLSSLRQASMLHFCGPQDIAKKLRTARFRIHTTSPSYPILASLDLARAQMANDGHKLVEKSSSLAAFFIETIENDPSLSSYRINRFILPASTSQYATVDPTKVSLNVSELATSATEFRNLLYDNYGIYVNRVTESSLLFNFHIGIDVKQANDLLEALRKVQHRFVPEWLMQSTSDAFIVPYPPGVPIVMPGEKITSQIRYQIRNLARSGSSLFTV